MGNPEEGETSQGNEHESDTQEHHELQEESTTEPTQHQQQTKMKTKRVREPHRLDLTETENFNEKLRKRGVVYLSRIPPRMGPAKVKSLLSEFGTVTRVYLEEEDKSARKRRQRASGSKGGGKRYTEGWVEYENKKVAKRIATALNNTPITNHKRSVHYGDLWNIKYLSRFKWENLTEKVAYERRVREQKLRIEMMQARKENQAYTHLVEAGKTMDRIDERRKKRSAKEKAAADVEGEGTSGKKRKSAHADNDDGGRIARKFKQTKPVKDARGTSSKKAVLKSLV